VNRKDTVAKDQPRTKRSQIAGSEMSSNWQGFVRTRHHLFKTANFADTSGAASCTDPNRNEGCQFTVISNQSNVKSRADARENRRIQHTP